MDRTTNPWKAEREIERKKERKRERKKEGLM